MKRIEISDEDDEMNSHTVTSRPMVTLQDGSTYTQVFSDTAVMTRVGSTPARAKKSKPDTDLGVAPLQPPVAKNLDRAFDHSVKTLPRTTATLSRPPPSLATSVWSTTSVQPSAVIIPPTLATNASRQAGQTTVHHTDQYGNPVHVFAPVENNSMTTGLERDSATFVPPEVSRDNAIPPGMDILRANPYIQHLVEQRLSLLEAKMKTDLTQCNTRKKSGRYNTADTSSAPHLKWPNKSCLTGSVRKRTAYDDLTLGQFVVGFVSNVLETNNPDVRKSMLAELVETVKLAENLSWPIARGAFAVAMHRVEEEATVWADSHYFAENRLTYSQTAVFNGSLTMSPKHAPQTQTSGNMKRIVCKWYNEGSCPHSADHLDSTGVTMFQHVCMYCFRQLKRNNNHPETDCNNKKKGE